MSASKSSDPEASREYNPDYHSMMAELTIRASTPEDQGELRLLERRHFPAKPGKPHAGYLFENTPEVRASLDDQLADPHRLFVSVADVEGKVEGFALALPFSLPGMGQIDPTNMLLQYLAVNEEQRLRGIGKALLDHIEERIRPRRQNVIVAHVPAAQAAFYRQVGWEVMSPTAGFAWLPFNDFLRADYPDPQVGYEHVAAKILRPGAIRRSFGFPRVTDAPIADAAEVLEGLVARGDIDIRDLDEGTRQMMMLGKLRPA